LINKVIKFFNNLSMRKCRQEAHGATLDGKAAPPSVIAQGSLHEFFMNSPLRGANLDLGALVDYPSAFDLGTNVVSEDSRAQLPHAGVVKWLDTTPEVSQDVSVSTLAEIEQGILRQGGRQTPSGLAALVRRRPPGTFCGAHSCLRCTVCVMLGSSDRIAA
jgi:hypothetical protein